MKNIVIALFVSMLAASGAFAKSSEGFKWGIRAEAPVAEDATKNEGFRWGIRYSGEPVEEDATKNAGFRWGIR